ncbi:MAG: penicillin-binding transpeptidase domain-containing protein [Cellulosilyticaceae bacterium]
MKKKTSRATSFAIAVIVIFSILLSRLFYVQLIKGDYYKTLAEEKGEKEIIEPAPRGKILDRNGEEIATSKQGYNITFSNYQGKTKEKKEVKDKRINTALIETIRIITKNGNVDKLNLTSLPIVLEGDKYAYNFTATSEELRAKLTKNLKKAHGIDKLEEKESDKTGNKNVNYDINRVVEEIGIRFGVIDKDTKKYNYNITQPEMLQLIALRTAISEVAYSQYKIVYIAKNVSQQTAFAIMTKSSDLPGISYEVAPIRHYPNGELGSGFLGYLGKIGEDTAEKYKSLGYDVNRELIGKLGLEKALENNKDLGINLRGEPGVRYVNVDKFGQILGETATLDPIPGDTVKTTIDINIQRAAEEALDKTMADIRGKAKGGNAQRGAAIVTSVKTGEVLALASRPGYDPNLFAETGSLADPEMYKKYFVPEKNDGDKYDVIPAPMFNYVTKGAVPPGSILKPFVGIAGLEESVVTPSETILDTGIYKGINAGNAYKCWIYNTKHQTHGHVNISEAIETSCNIYFFEVGKRLGYEKFNKWTAKFGLSPDPVTGERPKSGIEIEESPGEVGSETGFKKTNLSIFMNNILDEISKIENGGYTITKGTDEYKAIENMLDSGEYDKAKLEAIGITNSKAQRYIKIKVNTFKRDSSSTGELLNLSIGQGSTLLTPLQMVGALNTLLNDGKRYSTHLVKEVLNTDGTVKREIAPEVLEEIKIKSENKEAVLQGMANVTSGEHGTAASTFAGFPIKSGGKTGSAQVGDVQAKNGRSATGWFMGFAPYDNPEISIIVVIYDAGSGSYTAPVARAVYEEYFGLNKEKKAKEEAAAANNQQQNPVNPTERAYTGN